MNLQKASGVISNLQVVNTKQNILYGPQMEEASGISAVVFALAGMSGAAVQTSMNADGGADDVDMYSFEIAGVKYAGCTRGISLEDGDYVELVYEERPEGNETIAVRRPATRSIWTYPYMSRGSTAGISHCIHLWILVSLGGCTLILLIGLGYLTIHSVWLGVIVSFAAVAVAVSWMLPRLFRFSRAADEVFAVFGYPNPKMVDLHKTSKAYRKAHDITWSAKNNFELWY